MKKKILIPISVFLVGGLIFIWIFMSKYYVPSFHLSDYQSDIDYCAVDEKVEPITNKEEAQIQAKKLWTKLYGKESVEVLEICTVYYDGGSDCWLVEGKPPYLKYLGGELSMIASSDGKVLAVWAVK